MEQEKKTLTVWCPWPKGQNLPERPVAVLKKALTGMDCRVLYDPEEFKAPNGPLLFWVVLDETGLNPEYYRLLFLLRSRPNLLDGCLGGVVLDGRGELYTKAVGRELVLSANGAGCAFVGRPLVEATGSLDNYRVQAECGSCSLLEAYEAAVRQLVERLLQGNPLTQKASPRLLVLHASQRATSNTLDLWNQIKQQLDGFQILELGLRNGTLEDCAGCPYKTCLHFGESGSCFYGGVMVQEVYPAVREADAIVMLCPNYNDAVSANLTAFINRLTAMFRTRRFYDKALYAVVVSGYSGSDLVAQQLISALNMNKSFYLPARFSLMETANDAGAALRLPGIEQRTAEMARAMRQGLMTAEAQTPKK